MLIEEMPGYREWIDPPNGNGKSRCGWYECENAVYLVSLKKAGEMLRRIFKADNERLSIKTINDFVDFDRLPKTDKSDNVIGEGNAR